MSSLSDIEDLKKRIAKGDFNALNLLYKIYYRKLKLYGIQFSPQLSSFSVEDTIQELFLWISQNHQKLNEIDNLEVYLFSALKRNIFQDIYKVQSRKNLMVLYSNTATKVKHESSNEYKILDAENRQHSKQLIQQLLDSLPEKQKEVLYLRNYTNLSYKDIAEVMNLTEQVVRNYSYRAMQKLRTKTSIKVSRAEG